MRKCIARITYSDDYLSSWFNGAPRDQIHKQNLREFMAYGFWFKQYDQLSDHDKQFMEQVLKQLEQQTGVVLPEGRNPDIQFLSHLWDPLAVSYKPLMFYIGMEMLALVSACTLQAAGFQRHVHNGDVFYTYKIIVDEGGSDSSRSNSHAVVNDDPLVFVHGVGAGLLPYLLFVYKLWFTGRALILPEYKHISMRSTSRVPTVQECAESLSEFLDFMNIRSVHVMGHSYGTLVCARFAISFAGRVSSLALMDPVCFAMYMPRLIRTFLYAKSPNSGNWLLDQALLMVAKELHCAATFCRQFLWHDYNLWPERLPPRTLVALSGGDVLCPAEDVRQHLEEETTARVILHPTLHHGAVLLWPSYADMVIKGWQHMLLDAAPLAATRASAAAATELTHKEPVLLHGTTTAAATTAEPEEEQDLPGDVSIVLWDQDQGQQQCRKKRDRNHQLWQRQWQKLTEDDSTLDDDLLDASSKLVAIHTSAAGMRSIDSGRSGITAVLAPFTRVEVSECPSCTSEDLDSLAADHHSLESSLGLDSPSAASYIASDDDVASGSSSSCAKCDRYCAGSRALQRQEQLQMMISSSVAAGSKDRCTTRQDSTPQNMHQSVSCLSGISSVTCKGAELASLCDCCCQQQWQQQVIKASCG